MWDIGSFMVMKNIFFAALLDNKEASSLFIQLMSLRLSFLTSRFEIKLLWMCFFNEYPEVLLMSNLISKFVPLPNFKGASSCNSTRNLKP